MGTVAKVAAGIAESSVAVATSRGTDLRRSRIQLSLLAERIDHATRAATVLLSRRTAADLMWRPGPGTWSVTECLDHISQTTFAFAPAIQKAIASAPVLNADRALRTGMLARLFVRNLEPPYRIRLKVLPQLAPQCKNSESAWASFLEAQSQLMAAVRSSAGLAIDRVKVESPVYARLSYKIYGALCILAAHERRHLWQMERILQSLDGQRVPNSPSQSN
jgi:hypothetical protein